MKAVACENTRLEVLDLPARQPARGQVVVKVLACGICGSDLRARRHADEQADVLAEAGYDGFMRSDQRVVLGHEFCGEVAGYGAGYAPLEFRDTLQMLAEGKVNATPIVTGAVGLSGVEGAFEALGDPERHAKILVDPRISSGDVGRVPSAGYGEST